MFTHIFPRCSSHDGLCRAVLTLLHPHWLRSVSEDPSHSGRGLSSIPRAPCFLHVPLLSTVPPAIRKFALQRKVDCILSCTELLGAPAASITKPGTLECYLRLWGLGPALLSSLGVSASTFLCCSPLMDSSLKHRALPGRLRALSLFHSQSLPFSLSPWPW